MKYRSVLGWMILAIAISTPVGCGRSAPEAKRYVLQLNWLHDPTFTGHYLWQDASNGTLVVREGGANIAPLAEVISKRADFAVVGSDIFLQNVAEAIAKGQDSGLMAISVDFQRNPVGWVMHPDAAAAEGLADAQSLTGSALNDWLFDRAKSDRVSIGDKRGTETTAVWMRWAKSHNAQAISVVPVGFDASVVLSAPKLAYPVYLNEEPFKLSARIGKPLVVFDPANDDVRMYGNVVVCRRQMFESEPETVRSIARSIAEGWAAAKSNPETAIRKVKSVYTGVDDDIIRRQIDKTIEFVFEGVSKAGTMDVAPGGKWEQTIKTLHDAGVLKTEVSLERLKKHLLH